MKVKLIHHGEEWLEGDFEPPAGLPVSKPYFAACRLHQQASSGLVGMTVRNFGTGVCDASYRHLLHLPHGADMAWHPQRPRCLDTALATFAMDT